jgi:hypothetical protein
MNNPASSSASNTPTSSEQVHLSPPWGDHSLKQTLGRVIRLGDKTEDKLVMDYSSFVDRRSETHEVYIRETERTKRVALIVAGAMIIVAAALVTFCPADRMALTLGLGVSLVVFAAGVVGFARIRVVARHDQIDLSASSPKK